MKINKLIVYGLIDENNFDKYNSKNLTEVLDYLKLLVQHDGNFIMCMNIEIIELLLQVSADNHGINEESRMEEIVALARARTPTIILDPILAKFGRSVTLAKLAKIGYLG
jgi:hypothetical protein